jgi:hypothetical protein
MSYATRQPAFANKRRKVETAGSVGVDGVKDNKGAVPDVGCGVLSPTPFPAEDNNVFGNALASALSEADDFSDVDSAVPVGQTIAKDGSEHEKLIPNFEVEEIAKTFEEVIPNIEVEKFAETPEEVKKGAISEFEQITKLMEETACPAVSKYRFLRGGKSFVRACASQSNTILCYLKGLAEYKDNVADNSLGGGSLPNSWLVFAVIHRITIAESMQLYKLRLYSEWLTDNHAKKEDMDADDDEEAPKDNKEDEEDYVKELIVQDPEHGAFLEKFQQHLSLNYQGNFTTAKANVSLVKCHYMTTSYGLSSWSDRGYTTLMDRHDAKALRFGQVPAQARPVRRVDIERLTNSKQQTVALMCAGFGLRQIMVCRAGDRSIQIDHEKEKEQEMIKISMQRENFDKVGTFGSSVCTIPVNADKGKEVEDNITEFFALARKEKRVVLEKILEEMSAQVQTKEQREKKVDEATNKTDKEKRTEKPFSGHSWRVSFAIALMRNWQVANESNKVIEKANKANEKENVLIKKENSQIRKANSVLKKEKKKGFTKLIKKEKETKPIKLLIDIVSFDQLIGIACRQCGWKASTRGAKGEHSFVKYSKSWGAYKGIELACDHLIGNLHLQ